MSHSKRVNKTKEQLIAEKVVNEELLRRKKKVRDVLYPIITDTSYFDATNFLSGTQAVIRQIFMDGMRHQKMGEIIGTATAESPYPILTNNFIEHLKDESVESGLWMMDQVFKAITEFRDHETKDRKVSTYKTEFSEF